MIDTMNQVGHSDRSNVLSFGNSFMSIIVLLSIDIEIRIRNDPVD
jgi:hypothetical protein